MALVKMQVTDRPQEFTLVAWDGSDEAADWISERFGPVAQIGGEPGARTLTMWGTWVIEPGTGYVADRWGGFQFLGKDQAGQYQQAAPPLPDAFAGGDPQDTENPT